MTTLQDRLRSRKRFWSMDGTRWYMDKQPDEDCEEAAAELDRLQARVAELEAPEMNELTDEQIEAALKGAGINIGLDDGTPGYRFIMMAAFNAVVAAARKAKP